jgi:hypothetical protein
LESGRTIGQSEEHNQWFEQATVSPKSRLPFVSGFYPDVIETPTDIELSEITGTLQLVD